MMSLNKVMIIGRLGRDPEIRYTAIGLPVVSFRSPLRSHTSTKMANVGSGRNGIGLWS